MSKSFKEVVHDLGTYLDSGEPVDPQCQFLTMEQMEAIRPKFTYCPDPDEKPPYDHGGR